jgi:NAD(P)-dependent dehydrogenase (short-subunit alcohol dehydrogenase family)
MGKLEGQGALVTGRKSGIGLADARNSLRRGTRLYERPSSMAAQMGTFSAEQLARYGFGEDAAKIQEAGVAGGTKAGTEAVPAKLLTELGYSGGLEGAIERLKAQEEAGVNLHQVEIDANSPAEFARIVARLV